MTIEFGRVRPRVTPQRVVRPATRQRSARRLAPEPVRLLDSPTTSRRRRGRVRPPRAIDLLAATRVQAPMAPALFDYVAPPAASSEVLPERAGAQQRVVTLDPHRPTLIRRLAVPGWPLKYLLVCFPLWWVLGLNTLVFPLAAIPMAWQLWRSPRVQRPTGTWMWGLFLVWQVLGLALIQLSPPGTHPGSTSGRVISTGVTLVEYAGILITLLYTANLSRERVPQATIGRWLGWFFLTVCVGGFLGIIVPNLSFRSAIEYVLPRSIGGNSFVYALVHPVTAQVQDVIGTDNGRPAAPFGYTNFWGNALSILLVFFVAAWVIPARGRRRFAYLSIVAVTAVPVILSLNRGLWIGIGVTVLWVAVRMLVQGHVGRILAGFGVLVIAGGIIAASPLTTVISDRLENGVSNDIRAFVNNLSLTAAEHSPIVGYGGTRHANGSSSSIAVGPSPDCPNCGDVATGSTGQLWSVLFNQGWVGTGLYFGFFLVSLWVYRRERGPLAEAALVTIALTFVYMLFYSATPVAPTLTMIAVAMLWREHDATRAQTRSRSRLTPPQRSRVVEAS